MVDIRLLALGNVLIGDDAAGPYLLERLASRWVFPAEVDLVDAGTPGFDLLPLIEDANTVIFLDSVKGPGCAGSVYQANREQLLAAGVPQSNGPHDPSLRTVLFEAQLRETGPTDAYLIGICPEKIRAGTGLSDVVREAMPQAETMVIKLLTKLGHCAELRHPPRPLQIWWEEKLSDA